MRDDDIFVQLQVIALKFDSVFVFTQTAFDGFENRFRTFRFHVRLKRLLLGTLTQVNRANGSL